VALLVRAVAASDRQDWERLFRGYRDFYELTPEDAVVETVWRWLMDADHELFGLVAELDGDIVGLAHWRRFARPSRGGTAIFLDDLFTEAAVRGHGVGSGLISRLQEIAADEGLLEVRWITSQTNTDAQRLYDRIADRVPFFTYVMPTAVR